MEIFQKRGKTMITFDELITLHKMIFVDTNLDQQCAKFEEEENEFKQTLGGTEDEIFELADMVIVSAGVARFAYYLGLDYLCSTMNLLDKTEWSTEALGQAVETKMLRNLRRNWVKKNDVGYHHENGIED